MLILSRRQNDKIIFPGLGISIEVVKIQGNRTSLGIDAPKEIRIVRHELVDPDDHTAMESAQLAVQSTEQFAEEIASTTERLQLAAKLISDGDTDEGLMHLVNAIGELGQIEHQAGPQPSSVAESLGTYAISNDDASNRQRVLLVDDDETQRTVHARELTGKGHNVDEVTDEIGALYALAGPTPPDVVLFNRELLPSTVQQFNRIRPLGTVRMHSILGTTAAQAINASTTPIG